MVSDVDGNKIPYADIMPNVGVVQSNDCSRQDEWNAILCQNIDHRYFLKGDAKKGHTDFFQII